MRQVASKSRSTRKPESEMVFKVVPLPPPVGGPLRPALVWRDGGLDVALVAEGPIATTTVTVQGKKAYVPSTGHTNVSFSIEHWFSDVPSSEVFSGCQPTKIDISLPPTGLATISIPIMGQNVTTATAQYFTSPTAITTTGAMAAVALLGRTGWVLCAYSAWVATPARAAAQT